MNNLPIERLKSGSRVLLQLSGGKDSIACLLSLVACDTLVEAIHFTHRYGYSIPTQMAKEICEHLNVNLHIIDISSEIENAFSDGFKKRPCRYCKSIMDNFTVKLAVELGYHYICVGDTADDKTLINRIIAKEGKCNVISRYFNQNVILPESVFIYRPLLFCSGADTLSFVLDNFPSFRRINDTGDKYFEYSREGCPLQFKDIGAPFTIELMEKLKEYNTLCSEFATSKGIRAAIHLPSEFIVTIPKGYEDDCYHYLLEHGCILRKGKVKPSTYIWHISFIPGIELSDSDTASEVVSRFCERIGCIGTIISHTDYSLRFESDQLTAILVNSPRSCVSSLSLFSEFKFTEDLMNNLCIEVFHTRHFVINKTLLP